MLFENLPLSKNIQKALINQGYTSPTPIQEQAIPIVLEGNDLVGCAQTGTGKTAAFTIPIIQNLHHKIGSSKKIKQIYALVVSPTRELAIQIGESFDAHSQYTNLRSLTIFGGVSQISQVDQLKKGVDILIATPGRLLDLYKQGFINLDYLHTLVLDEADQMLDMGFINDIRKIIKLTPSNRQTLLFSATMPITIRELADNFLKKPQYVSITPISSVTKTIQQKIYFVEKENKKQLLSHLIQEDELSHALVFTRTKHGADNIVKSLKKQGIRAEAIHGDKSQANRQKTLELFKNKEIDLLVATDIAARGIDIDQLPYVINFDLPNIPETYIHRIGRTGRAGNAGIAISFCGKDEKGYWKDIERLINIKVKIIENHPFPWNSNLITSIKDSSKNKNNRSRKSNNSKKNKKRWY